MNRDDPAARLQQIRDAINAAYSELKLTFGFPPPARGYARVNKLYDQLDEALDQLAAVDQARPPVWQPIETLTDPDREVFLWCVPKTVDETYVDTSGRPIVSNHQPYLHRGKLKSWGALSKATHWMPLPDPPTGTGEPPA